MDAVQQASKCVMPMTAESRLRETTGVIAHRQEASVVTRYRVPRVRNTVLASATLPFHVRLKLQPVVVTATAIPVRPAARVNAVVRSKITSVVKVVEILVPRTKNAVGMMMAYTAPTNACLQSLSRTRRVSLKMLVHLAASLATC